MHQSLCDYLLDLVQNSLEASASLVELSFNQGEDRIEVSLTDNGCGMDEEQLRQAVEPFFTDGKKHRRRKVGLGLPFLLQLIDQVDGEKELSSKPGKGTSLSFSLPAGHIDLPPVGSVPEFLLPALSWQGDYELVFSRAYSQGGNSFEYQISRQELLAVLGELESAESLVLLRRFLQSQEIFTT